MEAPLQFDFDTGERADFARDQKSNWEAVSYCWGYPVFSHSITCKKDDTSLAITPNVDACLRHLRKSDKARRLWVDAICINQKGDLEKTEQVRRMGQTYRESYRTHVWLGHEDKTLPIFSVLREVAAQRCIPDSLDGPLLHQCVMKLVENPWFSRRWILQESALSIDAMFHHGHQKIPKNGLVLALQAVQSSNDSSLQYSASVSTALSVLKLDRRGPDSILTLLDEFTFNKCSETRDRLFALFPLAKEQHLFKSVHYSTTWEDMCIQLALALTTEGMIGPVLAYVASHGSLATLDPTLPSWVPNWAESSSTNTCQSLERSIQIRQAFAANIVELAVEKPVCYKVDAVLDRIPAHCASQSEALGNLRGLIDAIASAHLQMSHYGLSSGVFVYATFLKEVEAFLYKLLLVGGKTSHGLLSVYASLIAQSLFRRPDAFAGVLEIWDIENKTHHQWTESPDNMATDLQISIITILKFLETHTLFMVSTRFHTEGLSLSALTTRLWITKSSVLVEDRVLKVTSGPYLKHQELALLIGSCGPDEAHYRVLGPCWNFALHPSKDIFLTKTHKLTLF